MIVKSRAVDHLKFVNHVFTKEKVMVIFDDDFIAEFMVWHNLNQVDFDAAVVKWIDKKPKHITPKSLSKYIMNNYLTRVCMTTKQMKYGRSDIRASARYGKLSRGGGRRARYC